MRALAAGLLLVTASALPAEGAAGPEAVPVPAAMLTIDEYRATATQLAASSSAGDIEAVRRDATRLLHARVLSGEGSVETDATILGPLSRATDADGARRRLPALRALLRSLDGDAQARALPASDPALLARLAEAERLAAPPEGGAALGLDGPTLTLGERTKRWLSDVAGGMLELLRDVLRWLFRLLPEPSEGRTGLGPTLVLALSFVLLLLAVGLLLAIRALQARGTQPPLPSSAGDASLETDVDPLSRSVTGWEERARELAAAGRLREALRAWYHALLVTLHAAGALHYRKGRTNWDHLATLSPSIPWRPLFAELTSEFDREWYGLNATTPEALARFEAVSRQVMDNARSPRRSAA